MSKCPLVKFFAEIFSKNVYDNDLNTADINIRSSSHLVTFTPLLHLARARSSFTRTHGRVAGSGVAVLGWHTLYWGRGWGACRAARIAKLATAHWTGMVIVVVNSCHSWSTTCVSNSCSCRWYWMWVVMWCWTWEIKSLSSWIIADVMFTSGVYPVMYYLPLKRSRVALRINITDIVGGCRR